MIALFWVNRWMVFSVAGLFMMRSFEARMSFVGGQEVGRDFAIILSRHLLA